MGIFYNSPYISILKLKSSTVDVSVAAATIAFLCYWDYRIILALVSGILIHGGCDIMNDIYDIEIDRICKPKGAIASGQISVINAWIYMTLLFSAAFFMSFYLSLFLFLCLLTGIIVGGIMYSHPSFRLKDRPGVAMADMALCFSLESIGFWSIYSPLNADSLMVAAYIFVLVFSLTFMKDFKDVAGDVNSLPLLLGIQRASKVCCLLTMLPLIPLISILAKYRFLAPAVAVYVMLVAGCIKILLGNPVAHGNHLKGRMILALTIPNFFMLLFKYNWLF